MSKPRHTLAEQLEVRRRRLNEITIDAANFAIDRGRVREQNEDLEWSRTVGVYLTELDAMRREEAYDMLADLDEDHGGILSGHGREWPTRSDD